MKTVQLKARNANGIWELIPGPEFTREELEPLSENMQRADVAILEVGERVMVPFGKSFTRQQVLDGLQSL